MGFKVVREIMIKKYWDAIVAMFAKYGMDTFVCFEMLLANGRAFAAGTEPPYPIDVEVDYAAFNEEAVELYKED